MQDIEHKVAVVTGAASGIGLGITRALVAEGVNVAMLDVEASALGEAHASLNDANVDVQRYVCDVSSRDQTRQTAEAIAAHFGKIHILCNNAGVVAGGPVGELSYADWDWVIGVNLYGVINGLQEYVPLIKSHGEGGHIVNTASILGHLSAAGQAIYAATKYAVVGLSESARADLAPHNIGVSALCPGMIATNIISSDRNRPETLDPPGSDFAGGARDAIAQMFAAQGLHPDRVGEQVVHGIRENKTFIFTHDGLKEPISTRYESIMASFDGTEAPSTPGITP